MVLKKLTAREKIILTLTIFTGGVYCVYAFIYSPLVQYKEEVGKKINIAERKLLKNIRIVSQAAIVNDRYEKNTLPLRQKFSDEKEMAAILSEIEGVANQINMRLADMKPAKVRPVDFYNNFSVSLTIDGDLSTIVHFLYILQNAPHYFDINDVRLEKGSIRAAQIKCYLTLNKALIPAP